MNRGDAHMFWKQICILHNNLFLILLIKAQSEWKVDTFQMIFKNAFVYR